MIWMRLWIIAIILSIGYGLYEGYGIGEKISYAILFGFLAIFLGGLLTAGLNGICYMPSDKLTLVETQKIYSLKDNTYLSGYGFISVRIEEEDKYTYMFVNEDGTYSKKSIESKYVKIKEIDDCKEPVLEVYERESKNEFWSAFTEYCYCFVVPKGTVVNTFNINLE